jgi:ubiquinone/menaquinone biosynthesis C-methylase UbiE
MFGELAEYYDLLYSGKNYRAEVAGLIALARRYGQSKGRDWLDVACGTGRHLEHLRKRYDVVGVDLSPDMLAIARRRLSRVELRQGDMRAFRIPRKFDVVSCLFSAIGHLPNEREVGRAFANFSRHLKPGGVAVVEPWLTPQNFLGRHVHLVTAEAPGIRVARLSFSRRLGRRSRIDYHYLIGRQDRGVQTFVETSIEPLISLPRLAELMRGAGLRPRVLASGPLTGRGLLVGVKRRAAVAA